MMHSLTRKSVAKHNFVSIAVWHHFLGDGGGDFPELLSGDRFCDGLLEVQERDHGRCKQRSYKIKIKVFYFDGYLHCF